MAPGEKLSRFPADLMLARFYGTATIRFEAGKVTHVEAETRRTWEYKDLPQLPCDPPMDVGGGNGLVE
jgi:hypothetical protein